MTREQIITARVQAWEMSQPTVVEVEPVVPELEHVAGAIAVARAAAAEL